MSKDDDKPPFLPSPNYEVGYGKPPRDKRFRKGASGNPKGRPVGAFNRRCTGEQERLFDAFRKQAGQTVKVRDGRGEKKVPMIEAAVRTTFFKAVQGSARHAELVFKFMTLIEKHDRELHQQFQQVFIEYKFKGEQELARRKRLGITHLPDLVPHPDDIDIDFGTGAVSVNGPMTEKEKAEFEAAIAEAHRQVDEWEAKKEEEIASVEEYCAADPDKAGFPEEVRRRVKDSANRMRAEIERYR